MNQMKSAAAVSEVSEQARADAYWKCKEHYTEHAVTALVVGTIVGGIASVACFKAFPKFTARLTPSLKWAPTVMSGMGWAAWKGESEMNKCVKESAVQRRKIVNEAKGVSQ